MRYLKMNSTEFSKHWAHYNIYVADREVVDEAVETRAEEYFKAIYSGSNYHYVIVNEWRFEKDDTVISADVESLAVGGFSESNYDSVTFPISYIWDPDWELKAVDAHKKRKIIDEIAREKEQRKALYEKLLAYKECVLKHEEEFQALEEEFGDV